MSLKPQAIRLEDHAPEELKALIHEMFLRDRTKLDCSSPMMVGVLSDGKLAGALVSPWMVLYMSPLLMRLGQLARSRWPEIGDAFQAGGPEDWWVKARARLDPVLDRYEYWNAWSTYQTKKPIGLNYSDWRKQQFGFDEVVDSLPPRPSPASVVGA